MNSNGRIPEYVRRQYGGTSHGFRKAKRAELRAVERTVEELRYCCAHFPEGSYRVDRIAELVRALKVELSVSNWGY